VPIVDASVWVAYFHEADPAHARSFTWVENAIAAGETLVAPSLLLAEVAGALRRISGRPETAAEIVEHLLTVERLDLVELDRPRALRAAEVAATTALRGAAAVYLALAVERGDVLISVDRRQRERGSQAAKVRVP
jgi:predicted nucleic acid-binding protein